MVRDLFFFFSFFCPPIHPRPPPSLPPFEIEERIAPINSSPSPLSLQCGPLVPLPHPPAPHATPRGVKHHYAKVTNLPAKGRRGINKEEKMGKRVEASAFRRRGEWPVNSYQQGICHSPHRCPSFLFSSLYPCPPPFIIVSFSSPSEVTPEFPSQGCAKT